MVFKILSLSSSIEKIFFMVEKKNDSYYIFDAVPPAFSIASNAVLENALAVTFNLAFKVPFPKILTKSFLATSSFAFQ